MSDNGCAEILQNKAYLEKLKNLHATRWQKQSESAVTEEADSSEREFAKLLIQFGLSTSQIQKACPHLKRGSLNHLYSMANRSNPNTAGDRSHASSIRHRWRYMSSSQDHAVMSLYLLLYHRLGGDSVLRQLDYQAMIMAWILLSKSLLKLEFSENRFEMLSPNMCCVFAQGLADGFVQFEYCKNCASMYISFNYEKFEKVNNMTVPQFNRRIGTCPFCSLLDKASDLSDNDKRYAKDLLQNIAFTFD